MAASACELEAMSGEAAWITGEDGLVISWNPGAEQLFGLAAGAMLGRPCTALLECCALRDTVCPCSSWRQDTPEATQQLPTTFALYHHCRDGRTLVVQISAVLVVVTLAEAQHHFVLHLAHAIPRAQGAPYSQIRLLGPVEVRRPDGAFVGGLRWNRTKVRALLAVLALHLGLPVHREFLVDVLWPDFDYSRALQNLNSTVSDLRFSLNPPGEAILADLAVIYENNHYMLVAPCAACVDTVGFTQELAAARAASTAESAAAHYRAALALHRGEFLANVIHVCSNDYFLREQEYWQTLYVMALAEYAALETACGHEAAAQELYERVLVEDPCNEHACCQLMRLLISGGKSSKALLHFDRLARALEREIGAAPSEETYALRQLASRSRLPASGLRRGKKTSEP